MPRTWPKSRVIPFVFASSLIASSVFAETSIATDLLVSRNSPVAFQHVLSGSNTKRVVFDLDNSGDYATISLYANEQLVIDNLNVPASGKQTVSALVRFDQLGEVDFRLKSLSSNIKVQRLVLEDVDTVSIPQYVDISRKAGLDKVSSLKFSGPSVADINNNGYYDFVVNNHNDESSKIYWNNGDGTVTKHHKNLSRWYKHDLHGTSFGDYNNSGQLDLLLAQGGGNGRNPTRANFFHNKDGEFVLYTGDVGIEMGARGRASKWTDIDNNGLLDLVLINEKGLYGEKPQHHFYKNLGNGKFEMMDVGDIQNQVSSRTLITDLNNDGIDDFIFYDHYHRMSVWLGNGDFTFTEITDRFPPELVNSKNIAAVVDIDINNNGRKDLYFARGKGYGMSPMVDFDPELQQFSIASNPTPGREEWTFEAPGSLKIDNYDYLGRFPFVGKDYPIFLGADKKAFNVQSREEFEFSPSDAKGWPEDTSASGAYFGYLGDGQWRAALVRESTLFFTYRFNLTGVVSYELDFKPINRNFRDYLIRNDGDKFVDVSHEWDIPMGGDTQGVTRGDFNNNGRQDLLVYRWGNLNHRISDVMLLNNNDRFEAVTMHGAADVGGPGYGDMGQAFDFDLSGQLDILSGSAFGEWYLYSNQSPDNGNHTLVRVGYSPRDNVDPLSATVEVKTADNVWRQRVGSAGEVFSQSLLNIVHFGLDKADEIELITVTWRNGETMEFVNKPVNQLIDTNKPDPESIAIVAISEDIRQGAVMNLDLSTTPINGNDAVVWQSSNDNVLKVNQSGQVTAVGKVGQSATISASSQANGQQTQRVLEIVEWSPRPIKSLVLSAEKTEMIEGQSQTFALEVMPAQPDDARVLWRSSDKGIATVDSDGQVTAKSAGDVVIRAYARANTDIFEQVNLTVEPNVPGFARFVDKSTLKKSVELTENLEFELDYHAGTGNQVISSNEGGVKLWLRHFEYNANRKRAVPKKDIVLVDSTVLNTESGKATFKIAVDDLIPASELPEGEFYLLRATFTSSDGTFFSDEIRPIKFVSK
ncbi:FG-GAP-like repeat-containing protein [Vibrio sp. WXL210]|uniref:FG-GAP-like repeat-containing protein n=1 Tax=Vibrio sp. WXL210 TaxID=3450709 RepID=UPI003EC77E67